jgi:cytochrome b561
MVTRYHSSQVVLHWLSAALVLVAWLVGAFVFDAVRHSDQALRLLVLRTHMAAGLAVAFVIALRLALRFSLEQPPRATSGSVALDRLARGVHAALYVTALAMAASGTALAVTKGLMPIALGASQAPIPGGLHDAPAHEVHEAIGVVLVTLVALHAAAALYHQFVRGDGLLARMWFGHGTS